MRTLTLPLHTASSRARLVVVETERGVGLWATDPEVRTIATTTVQSGYLDHLRAVELAEFLEACAEPAYEPRDDQAHWLIHHVADDRAASRCFDLRLNRGGCDSRPGRPQGLLRWLSVERHKVLFTALNVPVLARNEELTPRHPVGAYLGRVGDTARWLRTGRPRQS
ncbi:hypothetical protein [Streptomyces sp. NPDC059949]|uniref:hypothetical protein n=1 Tax=Streptomyces sp. NPDC059949 TaxID=3347013 RepID=UPI00365F7B53